MLLRTRVCVRMICIPLCHNGAALQILACSSCPPYPLFLPLSLFQVQCRFSNAITPTIWWEHQLNCCCFSAAWPAYRFKHAHVHTHTHTHTHATLWLACVQIQTKPYGPSFSSFTSFTVCNPGAAEGHEEPAAPAQHVKREALEWCTREFPFGSGVNLPSCWPKPLNSTASYRGRMCKIKL